MTATEVESIRKVSGRRPLPALSFNTAGALAATAGAVLIGTLALSAGTLPSRSMSVVLFAATPVFAAVAAPVLASRGRTDPEAALQWVAAGLTVSLLAIVLQLISFPSVVTDGGLLSTSDQSSALLYLIFHLTFYGGALAGAAGAPARAVPPATVIGVTVTLAAAVNAVPSPELIGPGQTFTPLLTGIEYAIAALAFGSVYVWARASGRTPSPLHGWVCVSLSVSSYEVLLNAMSARRFDALWWASLTLRAAAFAVLTAGALGYVLQQLALLERYTESELARREDELTGTVAVTDRLLANARTLAAAVTPGGIGEALCAATLSAFPAATVAVVVADRQTGEPVILRTAGAASDDDDDERVHQVAQQAVRRGGGGFSRVETLFVDAVAVRVDGVDVEASAAVSLQVSGVPVGLLVLIDTGGRRWTEPDQELLTGLADQAGPALARAVLAQREHAAAVTLQRELLPPDLPTVEGLTLTARYQPAVHGDQVGGDWYDSWLLPDGRVALVVGDVVGKGLQAAATMGRLRASLRALAEANPLPGYVLTRLDHLEGRQDPDLVATVLYVLLDLSARQARIARAGHLPALVVRPGEPAELVADRGSAPIGVTAAPILEHTIVVPAGTTLLLYTDGLVEERSRPLDDCLDALREVVDSARLAGLHGEGLADLLVGRAPDSDDIALLLATIA